MQELELANRLARRLAPQCVLDSSGRDQDDYRNLLLMRAWMSAARCDEQYPQADFRERWIAVSLWREYRDLLRQRRRGRVEFLDCAPAPVSDRTEARLEARQTLEWLARRLGRDWQTLERVGLAGGSVAASHEAMDGTRAAWKKRVERLRARARKLLEKRGDNHAASTATRRRARHSLDERN